MPLQRSSWVIAAAWVVVAGGSGVVFLLSPPSDGLTLFRNVVLCVVPLVANAGLLLNSASPYRRPNTFWMLLALGCTLWMAGQLLWTHAAVGLRNTGTYAFPRDLLFFLHPVPMIGALALRPHTRRVGHTLRFGYLDLLLLAVWWIYVYLLAVTPWQYVAPNAELRASRFAIIYQTEMVVLLTGLVWHVLRAQGAWRQVYANLLGAAGLHLVAIQMIEGARSTGAYSPGSVYDIPLVAAFVWYGTSGIVARRLEPAPGAVRAASQDGGVWPARLAMGGLLSMPLVAAWSTFLSGAPEAVRDFRLLVTLTAMMVASLLVFLRQQLVEAERARLLRESQETVGNLRRLQTQFVQSEKLAALGQLAAGAAHEINNPLTAILGYAEILAEDPAVNPKQREAARKVLDQARRTKTLVTNLLSFARQVPVDRVLLDVNQVVTRALELRTVDLHRQNIKIELVKEPVLPGIRGDQNQLLQVFYNLISNAVDAMAERGGGVLTVRTRRAGANVVIEFSDTGPGIREPHMVFDPFYTTKPVGKGTGLGLSICYGIVQEHRGQISCRNEPEGGATFVVQLPAILALFPRASGEAPGNVPAKNSG
jgi:signal transduction histidine kinase